MALRFLGGDTGNQGSPRLWEDGPDPLVQGYTVDDQAVLDECGCLPVRQWVRVPKSLMKYLQEAGDGTAGP